MDWTYDLATGFLYHGATLIGEGAATVAAGRYTLGDVTDFAEGIPLQGAGPGARLTADADAENSIILPADVITRVIASRAKVLTVVETATAETIKAPAEPAPEE